MVEGGEHRYGDRVQIRDHRGRQRNGRVIKIAEQSSF